ncbi:Uncharacterised protein [Yersinia mollaretii]|nr:Uncharacterised protein [Yersinia mollaretii]CQJ10736.1 Uncharacterised protein [Yersinia mollaretii]
MVSPTLPGCPHHVSIDETSMLIRAFLFIALLKIERIETGYSP